MDVIELFRLTKWIDDEIVGKDIPGRYKALMSILQRNARQEQRKAPFEDEKTALIASLRSIRFDRLNKQQIGLLEHWGMINSLGERAVNAIEDVLYKNALDVATAARKIQEMGDSLDSGIGKSTAIKSPLENSVMKEEPDGVEAGSVLVRVTFDQNAKIVNIADLKVWGNTWYEIARGIAMVHNQAPEVISIVGAGKGSFIIDLSVVTPMALTVSSIIWYGLRVTERVFDIRKKAEEIRGLKLSNDKIQKELEQEAELIKTQAIDTITKDVIKTSKLEDQNEGDKIAALTKAVEDLVEFLERGGSVDFVLPEAVGSKEDDKEPSVELQLLRDRVYDIHQLEQKIPLLEQLK